MIRNTTRQSGGVRDGMQEVVNGGATVGERPVAMWLRAWTEPQRRAEHRRAHEARLSGSQIQPFHLNQMSGRSAEITISAKLH